VGGYLAVLRVPLVAPLLFSAILARLPIGINSIAVVLFCRAEGYSYAVAGAVAGALALGSGLSAPVQGRVIDRLGPRRVLPPLAALHAGSLVALVAAGTARAPVAALIALGAAAGIGLPPMSSVMRALWPTLLRGREHLAQRAFALDAVLIELIFVAGPLLTAVVVATLAPGVALVLSSVCVVAGTLAFVAIEPPDAITTGGSDARAAGGVLGALASPGIRTLALTTLPLGFCFGAVEVTLPAFSEEHGAPAWAGVLLATWSIGSATGGLLYGARSGGPSLERIWLGLSFVLPLSFLPLLAAGSVWVMALLTVPAGFCIAPLLASGNQLVSHVAPAGALTEAYTWPITSMVGGVAIGSAVAGAIVEAADWRTAVLSACAAATCGALVAGARHRTLAPA
jgi:MFS family permease